MSATDRVCQAIAQSIEQFAKSVDAVRKECTVVAAENCCMAGRSAMGCLLTDWQDFRAFSPETLETFHRGLADAVEQMGHIGVPASSEEQKISLYHCRESTRHRMNVVAAIRQIEDPDEVWKVATAEFRALENI